jgi:hypothetical protein
MNCGTPLDNPALGCAEIAEARNQSSPALFVDACSAVVPGSACPGPDSLPGMSLCMQRPKKKPAVKAGFLVLLEV